MSDLVITPAVGLKWSSIELFLKSLRLYFDGEVFFLISKNDNALKKSLEYYKCKYQELSTHKYDIQLKRYKFFYEYILEKKNFSKVLFCDSRDIYFQSNPFNYNYKASINFFLEDQIFKNCEYNSDWAKRTFGENIYQFLSNKTISCGGTVLATNESMKVFLSLMDNLITKYKYRKRLKYFLTFRRDKKGRGSDQIHSNYLIYKNIIKDYYLYNNYDGPFATLYHLKNIKFNDSNQLINEKKEPYSLVHQYDKRWNLFSEKVNNLKKN